MLCDMHAALFFHAPALPMIMLLVSQSSLQLCGVGLGIITHQNTLYGALFHHLNVRIMFYRIFSP